MQFNSSSAPSFFFLSLSLTRFSWSNRDEENQAAASTQPPLTNEAAGIPPPVKSMAAALPQEPTPANTVEIPTPVAPTDTNGQTEPASSASNGSGQEVTVQ